MASHKASSVAVESQWVKSLDSFALELFHRIYYELEPSWFSPIQPEHQWAVKLHNQLSETREFLKLADLHNGDPFMSAIAADRVIQGVLETLEAAHPKKKSIGDLNQLRQQARAMKSRGEDTQEITQIGQQTVQEAKELTENLECCFESIGLAIAQASEQADEMGQMMAALGYGNEMGKEKAISAQERLEIAEKLSRVPKLMEIARMAGKAMETACRKRRQVNGTNSYGELVGVTTGDQLSQILPQELARLSQNQQKLSFYRDYLEGQLLQYELEAPQDKSRGEMIICIDESDSMDGINEEWAKGLTLALIQLAHENQRSVSVIRFSDYARDAIAIDEQSYGKAVDYLASSMLGGGTNFERPISKAIAIIEEDRKADLVFITDGIAPFSQPSQAKTEKILKETESSFFLLKIGLSGFDELEAIADHAWNINPTKGFDNINDVFVEIQSK